MKRTDMSKTEKPTQAELQALLQKIEGVLAECDRLGATSAAIELDAARLKIAEAIHDNA